MDSSSLAEESNRETLLYPSLFVFSAELLSRLLNNIRLGFYSLLF